jgi:hypothetical protein
MVYLKDNTFTIRNFVYDSMKHDVFLENRFTGKVITPTLQVTPRNGATEFYIIQTLEAGTYNVLINGITFEVLKVK